MYLIGKKNQQSSLWSSQDIIKVQSITEDLLMHAWSSKQSLLTSPKCMMQELSIDRGETWYR